LEIERLIGIIMYIINRDVVTANELEDHFDVSKRTIIRDIDTIRLADIPIFSELGSKGGYAINHGFKLS